jgi:hypothetical protein
MDMKDLAIKVTELEASVAAYSEVLTMLCNEWAPRIQESLNRLQADRGRPGRSAGARRGHRRRTYEDYQRYQSARISGMSMRKASANLDIPYSTCRFYDTASPATVQRLKLLSDLPRLIQEEAGSLLSH